ncbi:HS12B-like protein [Mya arenaria]|uniref:HS12B-like protein n=1 Tax=Mya arenaria TaxID=6604 RepID=A0ABY7GAT9_MYAAR|nr:HS12B-like protein [Mya arenaria]
MVNQHIFSNSDFIKYLLCGRKLGPGPYCASFAPSTSFLSVPSFSESGPPAASEGNSSWKFITLFVCPDDCGVVAGCCCEDGCGLPEPFSSFSLLPHPAPEANNCNNYIASSPIVSATMSLLVASIDFGTTFSGWAYSYKYDYETNKNNIHTKNWQGSSHISQKAPTVVLIKPDGKTLHSFGYEAESKYADLAETGDHKDWYYFRRFKMLLFDEKGIKGKVLIEETGGKKLKAIDAGIEKRKLTLALEPEAASLYCRHLPIDKNVGHSDARLHKFPEGTKYMVLDAGGGTVDITVHEIVSENTVRELHKASGGAWGGIKVDEDFEKLLDELMGPGTVEDLKRESMEEYLDLTQEFEIKKREIDPDSENQVSIRIPSIFRQFAKTKNRKSLSELIADSKYSGKVCISRDKLRLDKDIALSLFHKGSSLKIDSVVGPIPFKPVERDQTYILEQMYASTNPNAKLVTDQGCRFIGAMSFPVDPKLFDKGAINTTCYKFGGTEIEVTVRNKVTGELFTSTVDFLG